MPETSSSPTNPDAFATERAIQRLRTLTFASLALNTLILLLFVLGAIMHHHRMEPRLGGPGPNDRFQPWDGPGGGERFFARDERRDPFDRDRRPDFGREPWGGNPFRDRPGMGPDGGEPGLPGMKPPDPARMGEKIMDHLSQKLLLTEDEKAKIKPIVDQQVADFQKQMETQKAALQKQMEDAKAKIRLLLTSDQQKQLDAMPLPGAPKGPPPSDDPALPQPSQK